MNKLLEKVIKTGAECLNDQELLTVLFNINKNQKSKTLINKLLQNKDLSVLEFISYEKYKNDINDISYIKILSFLELNKRYNEAKCTNNKDKFDSISQIAHFFSFIKSDRFESFYMVMLDSCKKIICYKKIAGGQQSRLSINIGNIVIMALTYRAFSVILVHNHPTGKCAATENDNETMVEIFKALNLVGIKVFDSVIVANDGYYSFKEQKSFLNN